MSLGRKVRRKHFDERALYRSPNYRNLGQVSWGSFCKYKENLASMINISSDWRSKACRPV